VEYPTAYRINTGTYIMNTIALVERIENAEDYATLRFEPRLRTVKNKTPRRHQLF
jgi:hypothetical protein